MKWYLAVGLLVSAVSVGAFSIRSAPDLEVEEKVEGNKPERKKRATWSCHAVDKIGGCSRTVADLCKDAHNAVRELHVGSPPLAYDHSLEASAKAYALELGQSGKFEHSTTGHGENLYMKTISMPETTFSPADAAYAWWNEYQVYDYTHPLDTSVMTGHFTQMVWKNTARVGCGVVHCDLNGKSRTMVVAHYDPPGNYQSKSAMGNNVGKNLGLNNPGSSADLEPEIDKSAVCPKYAAYCSRMALVRRTCADTCNTNPADQC